MKLPFSTNIMSLVTLIVVLALFPAIYLMAYSAFSAARQEVRNAEQGALRVVDSIGRLQSFRVEKTREFLITLSSLTEVAGSKPGASSLFFQKLLSHMDVFDDIRLCDRRGDTLVSAQANPRPLSPVVREQVVKAAAGTAFVARGAPSGNHPEESVINCMLPVKTGESNLVLLASVKTSPLFKELSGFVRAPGRTLMLVESSGRVIFRAPAPVGESEVIGQAHDPALAAVIAEPSGHGVIRLEDGRSVAYEKLYSEDSSEHCLVVLLYFSALEMQEGKKGEILQNGLLLIGAALLALLIARRVSHISLIVPCRRLLDVAKRIKEGELKARITEMPMARELQVLADSLNTMAEALESRTGELVSARDTAKQINQSKTEFLANMSHEIRTPMNAILGMAYLVRQGVLTVQQRSYLDAVYSEARKLLEIINDILDFSKIEAGRFSVESVIFALHKVLEDVCRLPAAEAGKKGLGFGCSLDENLPSHVRGDPMLLSQVLGNIITNAIKFTEKGEVGLACSVERTLQPEIILVCDVRDTAGGMNSFERELLFPEEEPVDKVATFDAGTGLNLSVTRRLVRLMQGTISVTTEAGYGSTVTIRIPLTEAEPGEGDGTVDAFGVSTAEGADVVTESPGAQSAGEIGLPGFGEIEAAEVRFPAPKPPQRDISLKQVYVLLVEDNAVNRQLAAELLKDAGARVDTAENGLAALKMLDDMPKGRPYSLVLMDLQMPELDGFAATRRIRMDERFRKLPVIAMTAHDPRDEWERCKEAGMNDYVTKPFELRVFLETVWRWAGTAVEESAR